MKNKIQRVEITTNYHTSIYCPFCGSKVLNFDAGDSGEEHVNPCTHTLFVAHDEAFEYRSSAFNAQLGLSEDDDNIDLAEGIDSLTDQCVFDDAVKFAAYAGPPSMFGSYVGFTSSIDEKT